MQDAYKKPNAYFIFVSADAVCVSSVASKLPLATLQKIHELYYAAAACQFTGVSTGVSGGVK